MKLSKRIYKIAELVNKGDSVADIGTDHGYVPMLLVRDGKCPRVIMSDISGDSLSKARETFRLAGLTDRVTEGDFRVGDGLEPLEPAETDEIIIAGLGGHTIAEILEAGGEKTRSFKRLILQPRKHSGSLRYWLCNHGWGIESENLAPEGKFACEIITALPGNAGGVEGSLPETDIRWKYPPAMIEADRELALKRIEWKTGSIEEQLRNLRGSAAAHADLITSLEDDLKYLKGLAH